MKKNLLLKRALSSNGFLLLVVTCIVSLNSCGGNSSKTQKEETKNIDDAAFYETQPVHSGLYDADYYDITGTNAKKGRFDGRIFFSLSPETSAFYVFENGNRTKIDYTVTLQHPFEKGDSGIYYSVDSKNRPITINTDSSTYFLNFQRTNEQIKIGFNPKARYQGSALEILEKMATQKNK